MRGWMQRHGGAYNFLSLHSCDDFLTYLSVIEGLLNALNAISPIYRQRWMREGTGQTYFYPGELNTLLTCLFDGPLCFQDYFYYPYHSSSFVAAIICAKGRKLPTSSICSHAKNVNAIFSSLWRVRHTTSQSTTPALPQTPTHPPQKIRVLEVVSML